ncbi:MBL fold metallo-hydrolase [Saccharopolyspora phatthalungensis]|uniref:Glyoxylase-like metal-dependent hydrolase (Beta-lactamase superfamily II) n=1 Tax=Saccharopolyspora phatthalungensis TaxID=664693 RepID=A0A840QAZ0_9PSEU|nr:MBL fold metallo-hydrolase [Saccharopolyspora phatthalungensis]MBB5154013.1 glyoxylase-like metal-dependent hydrolase (beta-lactamase superfamily II) [Saccharopolyspora phatthalungensis]
MEHPAYGALRQVTPYASVLLAHNPSPMTLEGTNTWVVREPDAGDCVVIDPGPADADHLRRVADQGPVSLVLLTHHHSDHTGGAARFAELTGAPVRALDPALCLGAGPIQDGESIKAGGMELRVIATAGHTADSVCFVVDHEEPAVFTGDSLLGRGTTVVAYPDGHLGSYFESLRLLAGLPPGLRVLPGHGPELPDVRTIANAYLEHREQRLDQVRAAVRDHGPAVTPRQVVEVVYVDVDRSVWPAAELTVQAQLAYLRERGELRS